MSKAGRTATLIAVIVIGIGTVVTFRVRARNKEIAWAMYADIHNMATSQAAYSMDNATFAKDLSDRYQPTHGAAVRITAASDTSWSAIATHPATKKVCVINYSEPRRASQSQVNAARHTAISGYACK